jgi:hypothetical protein
LAHKQRAKLLILASADFAEHAAELRQEPVELFDVSFAQLVQAPAAERGQAQADDALVVPVGSTADQPRGFGPVDEFDGAVVAEQECLGDVSDRRPIPIRLTPNREQQLVLGRSEPDGHGLLLAPVQEPTQARTELEKTLVVGVGKIVLHLYIVPR